MKYKKQIATGALALSLLVGGSTVSAVTPQDLGIKNIESTYQKHDKNLKIKTKGSGSTVGTILTISNNGFTVEVKNMKTKDVSSADIITDESTTYSKNGLIASIGDLAIGQKVIVLGKLDKTTNIITAQTVKIVTKVVGVNIKNKKLV